MAERSQFLTFLYRTTILTRAARDDFLVLHRLCYWSLDCCQVNLNGNFITHKDAA
jgi:hypothetical protein